MNRDMGNDQYPAGPLQSLFETALFRTIARFLILTQILMGLPTPAYAGSAASNGPAVIVQALTDLTVSSSYQLISSKRITRTLFDFTYKVQITNSGAEHFGDVAATVTSIAAATTIVDGNVMFGAVAPGATVTSQDTFTLRQDRTLPFNPADLVWTMLANRAPVADAGPNQTVAVGAVVQLDGGESSDADGDSLDYAWKLVSVPAGSTASLSDSAAVKPTFVADRHGTYKVELIVNDGSTPSLKAEVTISTINTIPVAVARLNQPVKVGQTAQLDGSASYDVDADPLTFHWTLLKQPAGSTTVLSDPGAVNPALPIEKAGQYTVELVVYDGLEDSEAVQLIINTENTAPEANAGQNRKITLNDKTQLDGSGSTDIDGDPLNFFWSLTAKPVNSSASLSDPSAVKPEFTADLPGDYIAQLIVNDGKVNSLPNTVTLTTKNNAPLADAGTPQTVPRNTTVTLDGSKSSDADQDPLTYLWSLTSIPSGSAAALSDPQVQKPQFFIDLPGDYIAQLIVNDGKLPSAPATVTISTENSQPEANAGPDQQVKEGDTVQLDGSASNDADQNPLTYQWSFTAKPQNSAAVLTDTTADKPSFLAEQAGLYVLQLIVNDGKLNSQAATVSIDAKPLQVTVPDVVGLPEAEANAVLTAAKLTLGAVTQEPSDTIPAGQVISQNPLAGTQIDKNSAVNLVVSQGLEQVAVPNVVGQPEAAATNAITAAQLVVGAVTQEHSDTVPAGQVISQNPAAATQVNKNSAVNFVVSKGPEQVAVPNVVGQTEAVAGASITSAQLTVGAVTQEHSDTIPVGQVTSQNPAAATQVNKNSAVNFVVSKGPEQVAVPNVVGQTEAVAGTTITAAQLTLGAVTQENSDTVPAGQVISQNPAAATQVNKNSAVNLVVSKGPEQVAVPNVVGQTEAVAGTTITAAQLTLGAVTQENSDTVPAGQVISQNPAAATQVNKNSAVNLVVSKGLEQVAVPNVVGQTETVASTTITAAQLTVGAVTQEHSDTVPNGQVMSQNPGAATQVNKNSAINLVVSKGPEQVAVPNVVGQTEAVAGTTITGAQLTVGAVTQEHSDTVPNGQVMSQNPGAATQVNKNSAVNLVVSKGPEQVAVPNVVGQTEAVAGNTITAAQLTVGAVTQETSDTIPAGQVINQSPLGGTQVVKGTAVNLLISSGPSLVAVPDVIGQIQAAAQAAIAGANLTVGLISQQNSNTVPAGNVITQNPPGGAQVVKGSAVDLVVSSGIAQVIVPNVVGQPQADAAAALTGSGLSVGNLTQQSSDIIAAGNVISQNPVGGSSVASGSAVDLLISTGAIAVTLRQLDVTPPSPTILVGQNQPLNAIGTNTDGTGQDMTGLVTWQSSDPAVATITAAGAVTALAPGTTTIRASQGGIEATATLTVSATVSETTLPSAVITAPANNSTVTATTEVKGTANDANFLKYVLDYAPAGQSNFTELATGTTPVVNGTLGSFDPTVLLNDIYTLRLTTYDKAGNTSQASVSVQVARDQKVGNFSLAFQDLNIPVEGIPITVTRVYDSRDKSSGDFGFGWRLDLQTLRLSVEKDQGKGWQVNKSGGFIPTYTLVATRPHKVSVNLPDGRVEEFDLALQPSSSTLFPFLPTQSLTPKYNARSGTLGKLEVLGSGVLVSGSQPGAVELFDDDFLFTSTYQPKDFRYTTPEGRAFTYQNNKLVSIQEPNGNSLTIGANGIIHSSGKSITFTRDSQARITTVTDPNGNVIQYTYDSQGNLSSHKDPENNTTGFRYNFSHGLLEVLDPRGLKPLRNEYDDEGRLIRSIDSSGKAIEYTHDLNTRQEIVRDRLGNVTVHEYDAAGNVVKTTDPAGGVTQRSYDARGNMLTETDPLGRIKTFTYDTRDNRLTEKDALGNITSYTYNARNQVLNITDPLGHITSNVYDANGNLMSTTDPLGNVTANTYDTKGNLSSNTDALGHKTTYQYNGSGNLTKETDALGHVSTYAYDANGNRLTENKTRTRSDGSSETFTTQFAYDKLNRLIKITYPDGSTTETHYNAIGKQSEAVDQLGHITRYEYDDLGRLSKTIHPDGAIETIGYDSEGHRISSTDRAGRETKLVYDSLGRQTETIYPDGTKSTTGYDPSGQVLSQTDALGHVTTYAYDVAGRRNKVIDALGHETLFTYDNAGNQTRVTDANGHSLDFTYDLANRRTQVIYPDGTKDITTYDSLGRSVKKTDQAGVETRFVYDALGRLVKVIDALNQETIYNYDELGNRISQTDANGHTTQFVYDDQGRRTGRTLPLGQTEAFEYDEVGNLASKTDFNGKISTYSYDALNRLVAKTPDPSFGEPVVTYSYTASGQRETMTDVTGVTTYTYDSRDRLVEKAAPQGVLSYEYDAQGNLIDTHSNHQDGVDIVYQYDELNRLSKVIDQRLINGETTYQYDAVGNLAGYAYPNGVTSSYTYNSLNRLTDLKVKQGVTDQARYSYTLGAAGNRTQVQEISGRTVQYHYDGLYRLVKETINGVVLPAQNGVIDYSYDPVGNRLSRTSTLPAIAQQTFAYDANDRLTTDSYDDNGNTIGSSGKTYGYDSENHLTTQNGNAVGIAYDGDGNRAAETVAGVTTEYLVDTLNPTGYAQVLEEIINGQVVHRYTYGLDLISQTRKSGVNWETHFYGYDGHGSVRFLTDVSGNITDRYDYDAFGNLISTTGSTQNKYLYSGEQLDVNIGFYYLRSRYLSPMIGRFMSMDSFAGNIHDPVSLHKYLYANANPINMIDPTGTQSLSEVMIAIDIAFTLYSIYSGFNNVMNGDYGAAALDFVSVAFWGLAGSRNVFRLGSWWLKANKVRTIYNNSVRTIEETVSIMKAARRPLKEIAEAAVKIRNEAKIASRALMDAQDVAKLEARNLQKYGNAVGPTLDDLLRQYGSYEEIIEKSMETSFWYNLLFLSF